MRIDPLGLRRCLARWPTGVAVVTTVGPEGERRGLTINSFASVSLDPPLVLWSLARSAQSFAAFASCRQFAINVLAHDQHDLAKLFSTSGGDKFAGMQVQMDCAGMPIFADCLATLSCSTHVLNEGGDHLIVIGRVRQLQARDADPLVFHEGELKTVGVPVPRAARAQPDAALVIVGNELLSAATADVNGSYIARRLGSLGIDLREINVIADDIQAIASTIHRARRQRDWVFVTGGLGPTHDDVTAEGVASAFGVHLEEHPDAIEALRAHHAPGPIPPARLKAALLPAGCRVLADRISGAAGFQIANTIVLPGMPEIACHLFEAATALLPGGVACQETSLKAAVLEPEIAREMRAVQHRCPSVQIGCYPYFGGREPAVNVVLRSADASALSACEAEVRTVLDAASRRRRKRTAHD